MKTARVLDTDQRHPHSFIARRQPQPDIGAAERPLAHGHHGHVDHAQRARAVEDVGEMRGRGERRRDDEIAGAQRPRDQLCRLGIFQRRVQQDIEQRGQRRAVGEHEARDVVAMDMPQRADDRRHGLRIVEPRHRPVIYRRPRPDTCRFCAA